jgi:hypothetical protein
LEGISNYGKIREYYKAGNYDAALEELKKIYPDEIDNFKSNLIVRFLTSPQLYEFDTEEKKAESIFQIYGQSFDKIKKFIDNIAYMRNVSYDKINNSKSNM